MQSEKGKSDRQAAIAVSVFIALLTAGITAVTFWYIYWAVLAPDLADARRDQTALYDRNQGIEAITDPSEERLQDMERQLEAGGPREAWLGAEAWQEGLQAGQEYIAQYPEPQQVVVLQGLNTEQIWNYMQYEVSAPLGVGCQYCHDLNNFASYNVLQKNAGTSMLQMQQQLNAQYMVNLPNWRGNYVRCATCHNSQAVGMPSVSQQFVDSTPPISVFLEPLNAEGVPQRDPDARMSLQAATLYYFFNYDVWKPYDPSDPTSGRGSLALTYNEESTGTAGEGRTQEQVTINQNTMNSMGWSLGVGCTYCHNSRNFYAYEADMDGPQFHPQYGVNRLKAQRMLLMTTFLADNWNQFALPNQDQQPGGINAPENLPLDGDQYYLQFDGSNRVRLAIGEPEEPGSYYTVNDAGERVYFEITEEGEREEIEADSLTNYAAPGCYTCHQGNVVPLGAINQTDIPEGEEGVWTFPDVLKGLNQQNQQ